MNLDLVINTREKCETSKTWFVCLVSYREKLTWKAHESTQGSGLQIRGFSDWIPNCCKNFSFALFLTDGASISFE